MRKKTNDSILSVSKTMWRNACWLLRFVLAWITVSRVLTLLALGWGGSVFYFLRITAFNKDILGYPRVEEILPLAAPAALPLLLGALVANRKTGWGRYVRWLCALPLLVQAVLLYFSFEGIMFMTLISLPFMTLTALPLFFGVLLLLRIDMVWCFNQVCSLIPLSVRFKLVQLRVLLALIGIGGVILAYRWTYNPLKPDAEMIAHFKAHRDGFEYLVNSFRFLPEDDSESPEILAIKKRLNIYYILERKLVLPHQKKIAEASDGGSIKARRKNALNFFLENQKSRNSSLHYCTSMEKSYVNFPVEPRIEQGQLVFPLIKESVLEQEIQPKLVADSLDGYPRGLKEQGYVYRRIEANWFIELRGSCK